MMILVDVRLDLHQPYVFLLHPNIFRKPDRQQALHQHYVEQVPNEIHWPNVAVHRHYFVLQRIAIKIDKNFRSFLNSIRTNFISFKKTGMITFQCVRDR